jgi:hypothetical protein
MEAVPAVTAVGLGFDAPSNFFFSSINRLAASEIGAAAESLIDATHGVQKVP